MEKAVTCYKAYQLVASLPSFRSIQSSLAVRKFRAAGKERYERGHERVCANLWCLMLWHPKCNSSYVSSADLFLDSKCKNLAWWAVTRRTTKTTKLSKLEGGRLLGQYGNVPSLEPLPLNRQSCCGCSNQWVFTLCTNFMHTYVWTNSNCHACELKPQNEARADRGRQGGPDTMRLESVLEEHHIIDVSRAAAINFQLAFALSPVLYCTHF